jgi:hypothetical protein
LRPLSHGTGFRNFDTFAGSNTPYVTNTVFEAITCAACHDPHDASNPHQLRAANIYTLPEGTRSPMLAWRALYDLPSQPERRGQPKHRQLSTGKPTWAGGSSFGVT